MGNPIHNQTVLVTGICIRSYCIQQRLNPTPYCETHQVKNEIKKELFIIEGGSYDQIHSMLHKKYPPIQTIQCNHCTEAAQDWAYNHLDPYAIFIEDKKQLYSIDSYFYIPLCKSCHATMDAWIRKIYPENPIRLSTYSRENVSEVTRALIRHPERPPAPSKRDQKPPSEPSKAPTEHDLEHSFNWDKYAIEFPHRVHRCTKLCMS